MAGLIPCPRFQRARSLERLRLRQRFLVGMREEDNDDPDYESDASDQETEADPTGAMLSSNLGYLCVADDTASGEYGGRTSQAPTGDISTLNEPHKGYTDFLRKQLVNLLGLNSLFFQFSISCMYVLAR